MARITRRLVWTVIGVVGIALIAMVTMSAVGRFTKESVASSSPTITEVQKLGELVVLRLSVADVMEHSGYDYKGIWIVRGDAQWAVDLQKAQLQPLDESTKELVVVLPQPRVIEARVNHEKSRIYDIKKTTLVPFVGDKDELSNEGWTRAQTVVEKTCSGDEYMGQARDQAELILTNLYHPTGWDVSFVWQDAKTTSASSN